MTLTGTTQCTLGNTNPPMDYSLTATLKKEVHKVRDFDENNYPDSLCPCTLAMIEPSMTSVIKGRKKSFKNKSKNKAWETRKDVPYCP